MKCVKCGAELKDGCLYCSVCGHEVQIVAPDYSVLEDDYLRSLIKEEEKKEKKKQQTTQPEQNAQKKGKKTNNKLPIFIVCFILVAAIIAGIAIKVSIDRRNANSYEYQVEKAKKELVDLNYEKALDYYKTALTIRPSDVDVRMEMTDIYMDRKDYDSAMVLLIEVVELDRTNKEAYRQLISIYEKKKDYDSIVALSEGITNTEILSLFEGYIVAEPVLSEEEGEYEEPLTVTIFSVDEDEIYYTTDGSTPDAENGTLYDVKKPIEFDKNGTYEIQAVCRNEKGVYSAVVTANYVIDLAPPEYPTVTPDGGRISEETTVTIWAKENCSIYYTWDGTDPTEASARYVEPLMIPEGNNILSVLVVDDKTGLNSGVYRTNFIFYP